MVDWTRSMQQTFAFYRVSPESWGDVGRLNNIISCTINRDFEAETLGSASITSTEELPECYIRIYLVVTQDGIEERFPLGTFLVQTPSMSFDGKVHNITMDAYSPLLELKDIYPMFGYTVLTGENIMDLAYRLVRESVRVPVVKPSDDKTLKVNYTTTGDESVLSFLSGLIANAGHMFSLDELGRIIFEKIQDTSALTPVWVYDDSNSSILTPDVTYERDLYGMPNVVEVIYSSADGFLFGSAENNDSESPLSIPSRGRRVVCRETSPNILGSPTQEYIDQYARDLLKAKSKLDYTISYTHGYCPVRIGDGVRLDYKRAGLMGIKARVIKQTITCTTSCQVSETAVYSESLMGG